MVHLGITTTHGPLKWLNSVCNDRAQTLPADPSEWEESQDKKMVKYFFLQLAHEFFFSCTHDCVEPAVIGIPQFPLTPVCANKSIALEL